jgi:hypothetical protein
MPEVGDQARFGALVRSCRLSRLVGAPALHAVGLLYARTYFASHKSLDRSESLATMPNW